MQNVDLRIRAQTPIDGGLQQGPTAHQANLRRFIAPTPLPERERLHFGSEIEGLRALGEQFRTQAGKMFLHDQFAALEQAMWMTRLRYTLAKLFFRRRNVAFDDGYALAIIGQYAREVQASHAGADDDGMFVKILSHSECPFF